MGQEIKLPNVNPETLQDTDNSQRNGGANFNTKNYLNTRIEEGKTEKTITIRLLPMDLETGNPFVKVHYHNVKVPKEMVEPGRKPFKSYICLSKNADIDHNKYGYDCPYCELSKAAYEKSKTGTYTLLIESFGSADGIYYGLTSSDQLEITFNIIDNIFGLKIIASDEMIFIDKTTGFNLNDNNSYAYTVEYISGLSNPNTRIKLARRSYETIYTNEYNDVDLKDYVTNQLEITTNPNEYSLSTTPQSSTLYYLYFKENLLSGTYKLIVSLYDGENYIGEVYQYIIIK